MEIILGVARTLCVDVESSTTTWRISWYWKTPESFPSYHIPHADGPTELIQKHSCTILKSSNTCQLLPCLGGFPEDKWKSVFPFRPPSSYFAFQDIPQAQFLGVTVHAQTKLTYTYLNICLHRQCTPYLAMDRGTLSREFTTSRLPSPEQPLTFSSSETASPSLMPSLTNSSLDKNII